MSTATAVIERPILFSGPMVRAILDGRKTQTRRVIKPQPPWGCSYSTNGAGTHAVCFAADPPRAVPPTPKSKDHRLRCPYGVPGDRLWVREAFLPCNGVGNTHPVPISEATYVCFRDGSQKFASGFYYQDRLGERAINWPVDAVWRPSIHMPRWASRITLEITEVRAERLQTISEADAIAEGAKEFPTGYVFEGTGYDHAKLCHNSASIAYACLWDEINAKRGHAWDGNPWVWVVGFERA